MVYFNKINKESGIKIRTFNEIDLSVFNSFGYHTFKFVIVCIWFDCSFSLQAV